MPAKSPPGSDPAALDDRSFQILALGRVVWGVAAYVAPEANARAAGLPGHRPARRST